jgi:hypothetical protein
MMSSDASEISGAIFMVRAHDTRGNIRHDPFARARTNDRAQLTVCRLFVCMLVVVV